MRYISMKALFPASFLALAPLLCPAAEEPLVYEEDSWVAAEQSVDSPGGEWKIIYTGRRHKEAPALQRITEITLRHRDGRTFLLAQSHGKSAAEVVLQPWSPDGKWLAIQAWPRATGGFRFYPVRELPQALLNGGLSFEVSENKTKLYCSRGAWAADGSFTFQAEFSGDVAPYRATISRDKIEVKRTGEFRGKRRITSPQPQK